MLTASATVFLILLVIDTIIYRRDLSYRPFPEQTPDSPHAVEGQVNFVLIAPVVLAVLISALLDLLVPLVTILVYRPDNWY